MRVMVAAEATEDPQTAPEKASQLFASGGAQVAVHDTPKKIQPANRRRFSH